jgi:hypothetical protein
MAIEWPDSVDAVLAGDLAAGLAYLTPARGVVITPMAPLGLRDREAGTVTLSTSLGLWKKLERIRANPGVAVAFHARDHADDDRPEFVLVQGEATVQPEPDRAWLDSIGPQWEHFLGKRKDGLLGRWLHVYYYERVAITIAVRRIVVWPTLDCAGEPVVHGEPLPASPAPQSPPKNGTGPRTDAARLASEVGRLPHSLLGWAGGDGLPMVTAVAANGSGPGGAELIVPASVRPEGGRRAGLTAHRFEPRMVGQEQRLYTGWLEVDGDRAVYAPHTRAGYRLPASNALMVIGSGASTRLGIRKAREHGFA